MAASDLPLPPGHRAMIRRLTGIKSKLERANLQVRALEEARTAAYLDARALEPPMTFKAIADVFGVTEAAVMQKVSRHAAAQAKQ